MWILERGLRLQPGTVTIGPLTGSSYSVSFNGATFPGFALAPLSLP